MRGVCVCSCTCVHFYKGDCGCQRSMEGLVLKTKSPTEAETHLLD